MPFTNTWRSGVKGRLELPRAITRAVAVEVEVEVEVGSTLLLSGVMGEPNRPDNDFADPDRCILASSSE